MTDRPEPEGGGAPPVALVTGAAGGIGRTVVAGLLARGFLVQAADVHGDGLRKLDGGRLHRLEMDVSDGEQVRRAAAAVADRWGGVNVLVNGAGVFHKSPVRALDEALARRMVEVNLLGALTCMAAFGAAMCARGSGRIINIASVAGLVGMAASPAYAASKAGLIAATRSAARELAPYGVAVNAVAPGYCDTPMLGPEKDFVRAFAVPAVPMQRLARPEEVAEVVVFLATCRTPYLTGSVITLDGGLLAG